MAPLSKRVFIVHRSNPRFAMVFINLDFFMNRADLNGGGQKWILFPGFGYSGGRASKPSFESAVAMTKDEERELREQLARLQQEHRDLDVAISALQHSPGSDLLQVQRLKKRKLYLRDRISHIEDQLTPDIIA